ncbi:hypothetical protein [Ornithinimicrobium faecis]|uniref:hypothetical protein n=1 Tax=Ornithinimicrobium faecis TaxID=2934158 RepID=UPI002119284C|nr:hypothetical protein [Ornithinimicrobium sp. HY1745]
MNTLDDLRRSLDKSAHSHDAPDPHELLRAVQDNIANGRDKGTRTPRLVAAAAAIALVAGGGWALSQALDSDEETGVIQPAEPAWELVDGAPPEYAAGLALVDTVELGAREDGAVVLEPEPVTGPAFAMAWCPSEPGATPEPVALVGPEGGDEAGVPLHCVHQDRPEGVRPEPLPDLSDGVDFGVHRSTDLGTQDIVVGLYREASADEFPYPDQQEAPDPPSHDVVIDASSPMTNQAELADLTGQGVMLPAATVESREGATLTAWAGEPGRLLVAVNGTVITNDGEGLGQPAGAGRWQDADPDLRGGYWHTWTAGASTREFDLSPAGLAAHGIQVNEGDSVVVAASAAFPNDAWQVGIDQAEGAAESAGDTPVEPNAALPPFAYGYGQVTAVSIPADGAAHEVKVGDVDPAELVWVAQCPESMHLTQVQVGGANTQCNAGIEWVLAVQDTGLIGGEPVEVTVASATEPVTVAAYAPREWEDYAFEESPDPMAASESAIAPPPVHGEAPPEMAETRGPKALYREVATVTTDDLDADGRAEITVPSSTDLSIWLETTGVSRMQLEIDGTPIDQLLPTPDQPVRPGTLEAHQLLVRDGWYSTWTTETSGHELRLDSADGQTGQGERDEPTVTIQVEAQDGAEVDLTFYEFVLEEDFEG